MVTSERPSLVGSSLSATFGLEKVNRNDFIIWKQPQRGNWSAAGICRSGDFVSIQCLQQHSGSIGALSRCQQYSGSFQPHLRRVGYQILRVVTSWYETIFWAWRRRKSRFANKGVVLPCYCTFLKILICSQQQKFDEVLLRRYPLRGMRTWSIFRE